MPQTKQIPENQNKIVSTGCLVTGSKNGIIKTSPLGSCVAVIAYDKTSKVGGIAHLMLPGKSPKENKAEENKYAENAITNLINELNLLGDPKTNIEICIVGGANVLRIEKNNIAKDLTNCVLEIIKKKELTIKATSLGGFNRRSAQLEIDLGIVRFSVGDGMNKILCKFDDI